jgi:hypothetical protein
MLITNSGFATTVAYSAWSVPVGTPTSGNSGYYSNVAVNSSGDIYIDGYTTGAIYGVSDNNQNTGFVAEYSASGNLLWDQVTPGAAFTGIAVDASSNVYVGSDTNTSGKLLKYNSSGTLQWSTSLGNGVNGSSNGINNIAVGPAGNIYFAGFNSGGPNALVGNVSPSGQLLWTRAPSTSPLSLTTAVAVNSAGDMFVTGENVNNNSTVSNSFVAEYDSAGNLLWNPQVGAAGSSTHTNGIIVDGNGNVYISGVGPSLFGENAQSPNNGFVFEYNSSGAEQWINRFQAADLMGLHPGPNGTVVVDSWSDFLGFDSGGNSTLTVPWNVVDDADDFAYNNGNIYFASDSSEPPTNGLAAR